MIPFHGGEIRCNDGMLTIRILNHFHARLPQLVGTWEPSIGCQSGIGMEQIQNDFINGHFAMFNYVLRSW
jgi:hypothetical protein